MDARVFLTGVLTTDRPADVVELDATGVLSMATVAGGAGRTLSIAVLNGTVCVGGSFESIESVPARNVACRSAGVWSQAGDGLDGEVRTLAFAADGNLVAGGQFAAIGGRNLAIINAGSWTAVGGGVGGEEASVEAIAIDGTSIVAGGSFSTPGLNLARFDGSTWSAPPGGVIASTGAAPIVDIAVANDGVYVAGDFDLVGDRAAARVARWTTTGIEPLVPSGDAPLGINGEVRAMLEDSGGVIAAGRFTAAGTTKVNHVAQLQSDGWHPLGNPGDPVNALIRRATDGSVLAGTDSGGLLRWDGASWSQLAPQLGGAVSSMVELDGDLVVAGSFTGIGMHVVRWNGVSFEPMDQGVPFSVVALGFDGDRLCAGLDLGNDTDPKLKGSTPLWCWTGSTWAADLELKGTMVSSISTMADGSLLVSGLLWFDGPQFAAHRDPFWQGLYFPGGHTARPGTAVAYGDGAFVAVGDEIQWWDGKDGVQSLALGHWPRVLLPTSDSLFIGGDAAFSPMLDLTGPTSAAIAIWDLAPK